MPKIFNHAGDGRGLIRKFVPIIFFVLFASGCATQSNVSYLQSQIKSLQQENRRLSQDLEKMRSETEGQHQMVAGQDAEFYEVKKQVGELQGKVEETEFRLRQGMDNLQNDFAQARQMIDKNSEGLAFHETRLSKMESYMGLESADKFKAKAETEFPQKKEVGGLNEEEMYNVAKKMYDNGDYDSALQGFQTFLSKYPKSGKADNAHFWIGETYFEKNYYEKSILEYEKVIKSYPNGNKVPAAYLKQGLAFFKLGENANARLILKALIQKYPNSNEAKIAKHKIAEIK